MLIDDGVWDVFVASVVFDNITKEKPVCLDLKLLLESFGAVFCLK